MKASDLEYGLITSVQLASGLGRDFGLQVQTGVEARLLFDSATLSASVVVDGTTYAVVGATPEDDAIVGLIGTRNLPRVCWTLSRFPKLGPTEHLTLQVHEFPKTVGWPEELQIIVDDMVVDDLRKKRRRLLSLEEVIEWLSDRLLLNDGNSVNRVLLSGGVSVDSSASAFRLHGRGYSVDVRTDDDDRLRITRVVEARRPRQLDERHPVVLIESTVRFVDATVAGQFRGTARSLLDELVRTSSSYLGLWKEYNSLERESTIRRARSCGWLYYSKRTLLPDGRWRFTLVADDHVEVSMDRFIEADDLQLEAATRLPVELEAPDESERTAQQKTQVRTFAGSFVHADRSRRTIEVLAPNDLEDTQPPEKGVLFPSLTGDRKRLERRELAQARIASATCAMPQLGLLIEGQTVPERRARHIDPSDPKYRSLIHDAMGGEPTPRQVEALRAALNTPDLCLIQGPPGTGKTRVVAALQSILAELDEARANVSGRILLTSYQHDAVENAALRTNVFGLPAMKIGRRRDQAESMDGFHRWRQDQLEVVRSDLARTPGTPIGFVVKRVQSMAVGYLFAAMPNEKVSDMLRETYELASPYLSPDLQDRLLTCRQRFERQKSFIPALGLDEREQAMVAVRRIRTQAESFADDGPYNCEKALIRLRAEQALEQQEDELLAKAAEWNSGMSLEFLPDLARLKDLLCDRLAPPSEMVSAPQVDAEVEHLLSETVNDLFALVRSSPAGVEDVLWEYLDALENDIYGVRAAIKSYTVVLAATCQQAASRQMSDMKAGGASLNRLSELDRRMVFNDVIIDEAARANPLDLFVPMALAERRIVLVGDHRQLPHILEPDVEREIERSVREETSLLLKKSLFERLFTDLKSRESRDGVKRTITLNRQFRMHAVLGKFVSDTFYKPHGEEFESVQNSGKFDHNLDVYAGRVAAWINVPASDGGETRGHSKRRKVEAKRMADEVYRLASQRPDLSFGVITFYSAQRDELMSALAAVGITESNDTNGFEIRDSWRETSGTRKERLRVGTVDAFQGKEFDVVLLSVTRSNDIDPIDQRSLRRKYGHLMLENRLCVAMSRQQRLLIAVGDSAMIQGEAAANSVPGLVKFYELCGGPNGIRL